VTRDERPERIIRGLIEGYYTIVSATHSLSPYEEERINLEIVSRSPYGSEKRRVSRGTAGIKKVIFNDPATIVFWEDGTKTVVKCGENDIFDPEKGLAMAIVKKTLGNEGNYYNAIKKWLSESVSCGCSDSFADVVERAVDSIGRLAAAFENQAKLGND